MSRVVGIRTETDTHRSVLLFIRHTELIAMVRMSVCYQYQVTLSRVVGIRTETGTHRSVLLFIRHTELITMLRMSVLPISGRIVTC